MVTCEYLLCLVNYCFFFLKKKNLLLVIVKCDFYVVARMARGRVDGNPRKRLVTTVLVLVIVVALFYLYSQKSGSSSIEYGSKSLKDVDWRGDESSSITEGGDDSALPKTIPVSYLSLN